MGEFYRIILENIIRFKYGKQMISYCIKGDPILDQTLGQNLANLSHCACRILSPSIWENIASIFSLMHIFSDIWKEPKKGRLPLVNFGHNKKRETLTLFVFSNPRRAFYIRVKCSRKRDRTLYQNFERKSVPKSIQKSTLIFSLFLIYYHDPGSNSTKLRLKNGKQIYTFITILKFRVNFLFYLRC